jgi:hypothetical protein
VIRYSRAPLPRLRARLAKLPYGSEGARERRPDELENYAKYRQDRAALRPAQCTGSSPCWVEDGPPALDGLSCRGCQVKPGRQPRRWQVPA